MPTLYLYDLSSFSEGPPNEGGGGDNGSAAGLPDFTVTTSSDLNIVEIEVTDNDDIISENGANNQVLAHDTTINGQTYPAGTQIRADYYMTADDGHKVVSISVGGSNSGTNPTEGIVSTVPLQPNQTYTFTEESNANPDYTPSAEPQFYTEFVVCFTNGTQIMTRDGEVAVEDLKMGDEIKTMDNGYQPIRWIGSRTLDEIDLAANPHLKPIRIRAGALGDNMPARDLTVSPQHRIFVRSAIAQRMFGAPEVLIPCKKLVGLEGIEVVEDAQSVTYVHFLFERHEIVFSNGAPTESLFTGQEALRAVGEAARQEIARLFPEITSPEFAAQPARPIPDQGKRVRHFASRVKKNRKDIVEYSI